MNSSNKNPKSSLDMVLGYHHLGVLWRYCREYNASPHEAQEAFQEMLKLLHVRSKAAKNRTQCGTAPTITEKLDRMWRSFMLYTEDYADFCKRYFGFFLGHPRDEQGRTGA
jgi:hypothetical protein